MRKITALMISLVMLLNMSPLAVYADFQQTFLGTVWQEQEGELMFLAGLPGETKEDAQIEVYLGDQNLPVKTVSMTGETDIPKTIYCLVDISGSMKGRMDQVQGALTAINEGLGEEDNLVIGRMGNQITDSELLSGKDIIQQEIDSLVCTSEDTDLYNGMIHGLRYLEQGSGVHPVKALVVLSDGCDEQADGATWNETYEAAASADIPIYTVAVIASEKDYDAAKELGSFARNSAGGMHFPKSDENSSKPLSMTGEEMGQEIVKALAETFVVTLDLSGMTESDKDIYRLSVSWQGAAGKVYKDGKEIEGKNLNLAVETTAAEIDSAPPETEEADQTKAKGQKQLLLIGGGVAVVLILLAVIFAVRSSKKKKEEQLRLEEAARQKEETQKREAERKKEEARKQEQIRKEQVAKQRMEQQRLQEQQRAREEAYNALPRLPIRLTCISPSGGQKIITLTLVKGHELTVGRNQKANVVLNENDTKLSGIHFVMLWDGQKIYLWDMQSRNGTSVNGVVVNQLGRVLVQNGDVLRVGSYEYRMSM